MSPNRNAYMREYNSTLDGKARRLLYGARRRAKATGAPCDLTFEWVKGELESALVNGCPYLGIPVRLDGGLGDPHSPSIDQFNPGAGYTKGNCIIVSFQANKMKSDARPLVVERLGESIARLRVTRFRDAPSVAFDDTNAIA